MGSLGSQMDREKEKDTFGSRTESASKFQKMEGHGDNPEESASPSIEAPSSEGIILLFSSVSLDSVSRRSKVTTGGSGIICRNTNKYSKHTLSKDERSGLHNGLLLPILAFYHSTFWSELSKRKFYCVLKVSPHT